MCANASRHLEADFREKIRLGRGEHAENHDVWPSIISSFIPKYIRCSDVFRLDCQSVSMQHLWKISYRTDPHSFQHLNWATAPRLRTRWCRRSRWKRICRSWAWDVDGGGLAVGWVKFGMLMFNWCLFIELYKDMFNICSYVHYCLLMLIIVYYCLLLFIIVYQSVCLVWC
jgi:hypothetical protein